VGDCRSDAGEDAYVETGQDNGTLRVTIREAAPRLGVTEAAILKRIQRGSLEKELGGEGRVYVYLDLSQDVSYPESQVHHDPLVEKLFEELRDRVAFLERALERRSLEVERYQQIVSRVSLRPTTNSPAGCVNRRPHRIRQEPLRAPRWSGRGQSGGGPVPPEALGRRAPSGLGTRRSSRRGGLFFARGGVGCSGSRV
jgi:hypothetical protein